jgi:hypothetical protein
MLVEKGLAAKVMSTAKNTTTAMSVAMTYGWSTMYLLPSHFTQAPM